MSDTQFTKATLFEHVAKHPERNFISIHENVYDVTEFLDEHPGGEEALKEHQIKNNTFKDATESFEDVGHSMDARDLMNKYKVGVLEGKKEKPANKQLVIPSKFKAAKSGEAQGSSWSGLVLIPLALLGIALAYQYFIHKQ